MSVVIQSDEHTRIQDDKKTRQLNKKTKINEFITMIRNEGNKTKRREDKHT